MSFPRSLPPHVVSGGRESSDSPRHWVPAPDQVGGRLCAGTTTFRDEQVPSARARRGRAGDARRRRAHVRRAAGACAAVPLRRGPAPHRAGDDRRAGRPALVFDLLAACTRATLRIAVKRSPGGVFSTWANEPLAAGAALDVMPPMGHFACRAGPGPRASLRGLRGGQRDHAARLDHRDDARERAGVGIHALLRQSRVGHRDVPRGAWPRSRTPTSRDSTSCTCSRARRRIFRCSTAASTARRRTRCSRIGSTSTASTRSTSAAPTG